jgi:4-hydroxy-3-methylbut-2-enyl diphosphate reductase
MVDTADDIDSAWLQGRKRIGLTAGASAPEVLVQQIIERLRSLGVKQVRTMDGVEETMAFKLPKGLMD